MKIAINLIVSLLVCTPVLAFDNYKDFRRDHWDFDLSADYFRSESNFGSGGTQQTLGGNSYFQTIDMDFATRYVWGRNLAFFAAADLTSATSNNATASRTNTSFSQMLLGTEYLAYSESFDVIPEVSVVVPTQKIDTGSETVANSEGVIELRPKLTLQKDFGPFGGYLYGGFTYRSDGRSFLFPWGVGTFVKFGDSRLGAEIFGYQSVTDDTNTNNQAARANYMVTADAGSYRYGSFNPSLVDTNFYYHMNVHGSWSFQLAAGLGVVGTNTADGYHASAMIGYSFDMSGRPERTRSYSPSTTTPREAPKGHSQMYDQTPEMQLMNSRMNQFKEDTDDGVDQRMFKPKPMTPVAPDKDPSLQKQLDDTEMKIELKSQKKKKKKKKTPTE